MSIYSPPRNHPLRNPKYEGDLNATMENARSPSPNSACPICLGSIHTPSKTEGCRHVFCFLCIKRWSEVKAECPLCKKVFKSIKKLDGAQDVYYVPRYEPAVVLSDLLDRLPFQYGLFANLFPLRIRQTVTSPEMRLNIYERNLYANPLPDISGRYRDCSPQFYRENPGQIHRLLPWLRRECKALLPIPRFARSVFNRVRYALTEIPIHSPQFRQMLQPYLADRTDHFIHELYTFASCVYDIHGYDRNVTYSSQYLRRRAPPVGRIVDGDVITIDDDEDDSGNRQRIEPSHSDHPGVDEVIVVEGDEVGGGDDVEVISVQQPEVIVISSGDEEESNFINNSFFDDVLPSSLRNSEGNRGRSPALSVNSVNHRSVASSRRSNHSTISTSRLATCSSSSLTPSTLRSYSPFSPATSAESDNSYLPRRRSSSSLSTSSLSSSTQSSSSSNNSSLLSRRTRRSRKRRRRSCSRERRRVTRSPVRDRKRSRRLSSRPHSSKRRRKSS